MAASFHCSIVCPTASVFEGDVTYASVPAWDGQMGFMPGGSPVLLQLGFGALRLEAPDGGSRWYLIEGGFAEFHEGRLNILSDEATPVERLALKEAEAELAEASARVVQGVTDRRRVERDQQRALAKVALAREHAGRGGAI